MATKRMFSKSVVSNDKFLLLPISTQALYFQYGMNADDDGFVDSPISIMRSCGAGEEDSKRLIDNGYIYRFKSGVIVILDWNLNNQLRGDTYHPTRYQQEFKELINSLETSYKPNSVQIRNCNEPVTDTLRNCNETLTQIRQDKISQDKTSQGKEREELEKDDFDCNGKPLPPPRKPSPEEVHQFYLDNRLGTPPSDFYNYNSRFLWLDKNYLPIENWRGAYIEFDRQNPDPPPHDPELAFSAEDYEVRGCADGSF